LVRILIKKMAFMNLIYIDTDVLNLLNFNSLFFSLLTKSMV